jgi:hypothetical protein
MALSQRNWQAVTSFKWKINDFSKVAALDDPNKVLSSDDFQLDSSPINCNLIFEPISRQTNGDRLSSLYLYVHKFGNQPTTKLGCRVWIENEIGESAPEIEDGKHF